MRGRWLLVVALAALGCRGGVIYPDSGSSGMDAGMDAGRPPMMDGSPPPRDGGPPPRRDGAPPPPRDGAPPPPDGAPPPPPDGAPPPPPDGAPPPPRDGGSCDRAPTGGMRCCFDDSDCGTGPGGMRLRCYGPTCASGGEGFCLPPPPPDGGCFGDLDCPPGQSCSGGSLGCDACGTPACPPPTPGTCE